MQRAKFKEFGADCTKTYRRKFSDAGVLAHAEECHRKRLADPSPAEQEMTAVLSRLGVKFEREKIILNGDRWVLIGFFIPSVSLEIELDREGHRWRKL